MLADEVVKQFKALKHADKFEYSVAEILELHTAQRFYIAPTLRPAIVAISEKDILKAPQLAAFPYPTMWVETRSNYVETRPNKVQVDSVGWLVLDDSEDGRTSALANLCYSYKRDGKLYACVHPLVAEIFPDKPLYFKPRGTTLAEVMRASYPKTFDIDSLINDLSEELHWLTRFCVLLNSYRMVDERPFQGQIHRPHQGKPYRLEYKECHIMPELRRTRMEDHEPAGAHASPRLHSVRGHFKLTKHKGLRPWRAHIRGDVSRGQIIKTYHVGKDQQ